MAVKALKIAGFIAASIVFFNLYVLFDKTFITHTVFTFEFVKNILQPAILSACLAVRQEIGIWKDRKRGLSALTVPADF